jgi:hypothetical protein
MAQIVEVVGVGEVEFPDSMSKEQITVALQKLPKPKFEPTPQNRGNVINTDVPTVVGSQPNAVNPQPVAKPVTMMDRIKTLYEVPTAVVAPMITEPLSMAYGVGRSVVDRIAQGQETNPNARDEYYRQAKQAISYQPTSPESQAVLGTIGEGLEAAKIPPYLPGIGKIPSAIKAAPPVRPVVNNMAQALRNEGQMIQEAVQPTIQRGIDVARPMVNQVAEIAQPAVNRMSQALRTEPRIDIASIAKTAPSAEELSIQSNNLFKTAKDAGVEINSKDFAVNMKQIGRELEDIGYDAELHPDIAIVLKRLTNPDIPKDFNKIKALRTMIGDLQGGDTKLKRSIATQLKSDFDAYLSTIPETSVTSGSKQGLTAWKDARDSYARLSKSEIFTDMLENAELDKTKFSMSGAENSLSNQLRLLAKNQKKMRLFTPTEQEAIKQAAKGTNTQTVLRMFGKFAPTSAVSSIPALLATSVSGPAGLAMTAGAMGARVAATKMRKSTVNQLAAMMRAGAKKKTQGATNE